MNTQPEMTPRLPLDEESPDGYFESDRDFVSHNREWLEWCEENHRLIAIAPEMAEILRFIREHIQEGASVVHLDALFGDDETTLRKAINAVCKKLT